MANTLTTGDWSDSKPLDLGIDHEFGVWSYSAHIRTLTTNSRLPFVSGRGYEIDLEEINSSAEMLDWIFQIHNKAWGGTAISDLVLAFEELFVPQANLCSFGQDQRLSAEFWKRE